MLSSSIRLKKFEDQTDSTKQMETIAGRLRWRIYYQTPAEQK